MKTDLCDVCASQFLPMEQLTIGYLQPRTCAWCKRTSWVGAYRTADIKEQMLGHVLPRLNRFLLEVLERTVTFEEVTDE